ncbi:COPII coat assembly protein sec16 [Paramyrothecium foliicola]|nr:COPII coat assembly protein sec16 [Paramyrothecium foliicola]
MLPSIAACRPYFISERVRLGLKMAEEAANSSWHPALMPNSEDPSHIADAAAPTKIASTSAEQLEGETSQPDATQQIAQAAADGNDHDARQSSNGDAADGGATLDADTQATGDVTHAEPVASAEVDPKNITSIAESQVDSVSDTPAPAPNPTHAQHSSSMSFARTVSHEVSFGDEDEGDWGLPRRDTDPFKFLPPSDRTNSFPVVPPIVETAQYDEPLPSNQALDVLEETERDLDADEDEYNASGALQSKNDAAEDNNGHRQHRRIHSRSIGGDVEGFEEASSNNRYEEGVPLIPQSGASGESGHENATQGFANQPFGDEEEDDFFTKSQGPPAEHTQPTLARKSTMQVLGAITPDPLSREDTIQEILHEQDEDEDQDENVGGTRQDGLGFANEVAHDEKPTEDLEAKWQQAFGDEDDDAIFLDEGANESKDIDAAAFWGSDDEGFLEDTEEPDIAQQSQSISQPVATPAANPYLPNASATLPASPYTPGSVPAVSSAPYAAQAPTTPFNTTPYYGQPPPQRPEPGKAQSFADKSKGGYTSPYDLPTDLVNAAKPRKRPSVQHLSSSTTPQPPPPPRSASMFLPGQAPGTSPLTPTDHQAPSQAPKPMATSTRNSANGFFEDLPVTAKPRPSSRTSNRIPSPAHQGPGVQLPLGQSPVLPPPGHMLPPPLPTPSAPPQLPVSRQPSGVESLVAPERVSPYAPVQQSAAHVPPPSTNASRYSPAPTASAPASAPPALANRYSPAPTGSRPTSSYGANIAGSGGPSPTALPHLPRTSSPLAHFEINNEKPHAVIHGANGSIALPDRRSSSSYEPRLTRVSSLPPTREVEEEDDSNFVAGSSNVPEVPAVTESRYSPVPAAARHTPPPPVGSDMPLSPPKRAGSGYLPQAIGQSPNAAPPRAHTQSPGFAAGHRPVSRSSDFGQRSASTHSPTSPVLAKAAQAIISPKRVRAQSTSLNMVPPTDGREHDPLERWKGAPILAWGVGGTVVTTFPKSVPRYGMNQAAPSIYRTPGVVNVKSIKDIAPLSDRLGKFPGPLKGKSKKKETLSWLAAGIDNLEKELPDISFHSQLSTEAKRAVERLLLWKILRVFIEFDGTLEGSPAVEKAVRDLLSPGTVTPTAENDAMFPHDAGAAAGSQPLTSMQADGADSSVMEQIRHHLLKGDREAAVWAAADKRLWGHAMLISNTVSPDLYKHVAQEFVRKEVNYPGHSNQSLGALYKVLSGNFDDCVDELVPVHARAGLQLISTAAAADPTNVSDGLDKWRETLTLILSNRCAEDFRGLHALGNLLSSYGRAEAAHICFLFSRKLSVFGGLDDSNASFVLLGSDHRQQTDQFAKDLEAVQLSEVYEYGLTLAGGAAATAGAPHLASYKLQHAITLAEYGFRDKALSYCEVIATAITSQTKRSPYHHLLLETAVDDFMTRLKQAPKGESSTWMSKPSMNKVSDSMWNRFNKFVAGDENEMNGKGAAGDVDNGPFARIATPSMSRSPSITNFEGYAAGSPSYQTNVAAAAPSAVSSRYAPMGAQPVASSFSPYEPATQHSAPARTSMDRGVTEFSHNPYEPAYPGVPAASSPHTAVPQQPLETAPTLQEAPSIYPAYGGEQSPMDSFNQGYQPQSYGYEPPNTQSPVQEADVPEASAHKNTSGGYEPPSYQPYGYEPPSYEPDAENSAEDGEDKPKPKKKGIMDDDDDDIPALRPQDKTKSEKDRENEEMFRKAAEEDAKRAAAQQATKKGWGFGGWFGGKKSEPGTPGEPTPNKAIRAKLGEESSFVYDPDLKRWINKKPGAENTEAKKATPPPPRMGPVSARGTPPPPSATPPPMSGRSSAPPPAAGPPMSLQPPELGKPPSMESLAPPMARTASSNSAAGPPSGPPSRPTTSMSNASSIDDLLSASAPRKPGQKKPRKSGRYVDVMAK